MSTAHHSQPPRAIRSTRVAANTARPLQPSNLSSGSHASAPSSQLHHASTTPATALGSPSSLSLFLRNLRLLDLDLLPDWPGISAETFAVAGPTSAAQGQKKRIQCVEWALFRLFSLWDPEETANKLKPFFPPLDHVQSLNLRSALLRSLEHAKKSGILGRDAVLRKTMLDECKGERLEDLLAVFSSAVLKKVVVDQGVHLPAIALSLAVENRGYKEDKTALSSLVLAHRVALHKKTEKRQATHARYRDFADLLGVKERGLTRRREEIRAKEQADGAKKTVSENARAEMRRIVRNNWTGDERWMETILTGDANSSKDGPFGMPFDRVWRRVQQDRLGELEAKNTGLLEQLDGRVRMHKERLNKWQMYRRDLFGEPHKAVPSPSKKAAAAAARATRGVDFGFGAHEDISLGRMSPRKQPTGLRPQVNGHYRKFLDSLKEELAEGDQAKTNVLAQLRSRQREVNATLAVPAEEQDGGAISELSDLEDDETDNFTTGAPITSFSNKLGALKRLPARPNLSRPETSPSDSWRSPSKASSTAGDKNTSPQRLPSHEPSPSHSPSPIRRAPDTPNQGQSPTRHQEDSIQPSPTQQLADEILASMNNASPSPSKRSKPRHTLSLAERTRLSMAPRGSSFFLEDDEPELESTPTAVTTTTSAVPTSGASPHDEDDTMTVATEVSEDLVSRTRRSMAGFEKAKQKAQLERRRSQRRSKLPPQRKEGSYFPRLDEDDEGAALTEEMLAEEDMEAVFRSRPKIKASPLPSPTREMEFEY